jgi:hypothetical protein
VLQIGTVIEQVIVVSIGGAFCDAWKPNAVTLKTLKTKTMTQASSNVLDNKSD